MLTAFHFCCFSSYPSYDCSRDLTRFSFAPVVMETGAGNGLGRNTHRLRSPHPRNRSVAGSSLSDTFPPWVSFCFSGCHAAEAAATAFMVHVGRVWPRGRWPSPMPHTWRLGESGLAGHGTLSPIPVSHFLCHLLGLRPLLTGQPWGKVSQPDVRQVSATGHRAWDRAETGIRVKLGPGA